MAEPVFNNKDITYFAETDFRSKKVPFGIKAKDRARHFYVIGKTGMGKSCLLENMAIQDIRNGNGLGYLDPHGSSAENLLDFVPEDRINDVIYFAPFDLEYPISFNIMEDVGKDKRHLVANGLLSSFKKIWPDVWSARMEYILNNTILALLEYPHSTLLGVNRMLSDKTYRNKVVDNINDPSVKSFWVDEFAKYNERYMQEAGDAIKNKIGQFTSNPLIRNIIGQPKSSFDMREVMDGKKILIANLSKGRVGEQNANLLGGMLVTKIYLAAMSRADLPDETMKAVSPFFLFVDEFQSFVNESFKDILAEARKYKLNLTIAHQYIDQMPEEVASAVFGNVGTTVSFRVGPLDAEMLEKIFTPKFTQEDLVNLGFAQIYLSLMIDGVGSPPFSAVTLPPIVNVFPSYHDRILEASRKQFAHPREEVEEAINAWHDDQRIESPSATTSPTKRMPARSAPQMVIHPPVNGLPRGGTISASQNTLPRREATPGPVRPVPRSGGVEEMKNHSVKESPRNVPDSGERPNEKIKIAPSVGVKKGDSKLPLSSLVSAKRRSEPTSANRDELRAALSGILAANKEKPTTEPERVEAPVRPEAVRAAEARVKEDRPVIQKEPKKESPLEVPEDVLRKILNT